MESFYLCENPLKKPRKGKLGYIYSATNPRFFAALYQLTPCLLASDESLEGINKVFCYQPVAAEERDFYLLVVEDNRDNAIAEQLLIALEKAVHWYCGVLSSGPIKITGEKAGFGLLADFNEQLPGVQVVHLEQEGLYLLSYFGGVECFEDFADLQDFLVEMGYEDKEVVAGRVNSK